MSTTPLTDGMQALINYANETTGGTAATLSDAIDSLVSGYGSGGGLVKLYEQEIDLPYYSNNGSYTALGTFDTNFTDVPDFFCATVSFMGESAEKHFVSGAYFMRKDVDCTPTTLSSDGKYYHVGGRSLTLNISSGSATFKCRSTFDGCIAEGTYKLTVYESPVQI